MTYKISTPEHLLDDIADKATKIESKGFQILRSEKTPNRVTILENDVPIAIFGTIEKSNMCSVQLLSMPAQTLQRVLPILI